MSSSGAVPGPALELVGADIGYDGRPVVRRLDLRIDLGEVVAVLGANGSGKSTLVRGVFGLAPLLGGEIRVLGSDRRSFRQWHRVGYVPQAQTVASAMPTTVAEVVASGRLAHRRPWSRFGAADRAAAAAAIESVGLAHRERTPLTELSGGQQRRVLIARALATDPEVLVLDEPTAGVDAPSQEGFAELLAGLCSAGLTIVLVTHELGPLAPLITRAIVMADGRVAFDGSPAAAPASGWAGDWHHHHHGDHVPHHPPAGLFGER